MDHYAAISKEIRAIFEQFTPLVEPLSLDEAFLDGTGIEGLFVSSADIGWQLKRRIRKDLQLLASAGIAPIKFVAKIASDLKKPDGFAVVECDQIQEFLSSLPVGKLWGVGKVAGQVLDRLAIRRIGEIQNLSAKTLTDLIDSVREHYWRLAPGFDNRPVVPDREAKSVSNETPFAEDVSDKELLRAWLVELVEQVARRLLRNDSGGRTIELKIRFADFKTNTRSQTLATSSNLTQELLAAAQELFEKGLAGRLLAVSLLGFGITNFKGDAPTQRRLFDETMQGRNRDLDRVADQIYEKFGKSSIQRGMRLKKHSDDE